MSQNVNKEAIQEWVEALRSGEYPQGVGYLKDPETGGYCCLGVLCEVAVKHGICKEVFEGRYGDRYTHSSGVLPEQVQNWAGLADIPVFKNGKSAVVMNDDFRCTFNEIADEIERTYLQKETEDEA